MMTFSIMLVIIHTCHTINYSLIISWIKSIVFGKIWLQFNVLLLSSSGNLIFIQYGPIHALPNIKIDITEHMVLTNNNIYLKSNI